MKLTYLILFGMSWLSAGHPAARTKPRPKPIEPDARNNDFRVETPYINIPDVLPPVVPPVVKVPVLPPIPKVDNSWKADANGVFWVKCSNGTYAGDRNSEVVRPWGMPVNF